MTTEATAGLIPHKFNNRPYRAQFADLVSSQGVIIKGSIAESNAISPHSSMPTTIVFHMYIEKSL
jgi:hypothetical protein